MFKKTLMLIITALFILGISKMSFAMMCGGHSQHQQTAQAEPGEQKQEAIMETGKEAVNAGNKICPVSGEKIGEGMEPATYEYDGKIYNFCCPMCVDEFKKDPQKYIKKVEEELQAESTQKEMQQKTEMGHEAESAGDEAVHRGHQH